VARGEDGPAGRACAVQVKRESGRTRHHLKEDEIWIKIHKVDSGFKSITPKEAIARQKWLLRRGNCFLQNTLKKSVHGFVGTRCKLAGPSVGKMRSYIARAS
jgi:hypothetical protein